MCYTINIARIAADTTQKWRALCPSAPVPPARKQTQTIEQAIPEAGLAPAISRKAGSKGYGSQSLASLKSAHLDS